jgi:hypothetical protein
LKTPALRLGFFHGNRKSSQLQQVRHCIASLTDKLQQGKRKKTCKSWRIIQLRLASEPSEDKGSRLRSHRPGKPELLQILNSLERM